MSSLTDIEKRYLEHLLEMGSGYVLDYSDATFGEFFRRQGIEIHGSKYETYGTSKAKKMRSFWEQESDAVVGKVLGEMMQSYEVDGDLSGREIDQRLLEKSREIVGRLTGRATQKAAASTEHGFLDQEFAMPNVHRLPIDGQVVRLIEERLDEARLALRSGAYLSVVFLCGSVLEAVLLGAAQQAPARFNTAKASPKSDIGTAKNFHQWSLAQFIDVGCEIGMLKPDVQKFSHGLRDFRNYIHPYQQLASQFRPDQHTAKLCFQVLKAALADIADER